jgi:hypothetical protein
VWQARAALSGARRGVAPAEFRAVQVTRGIAITGLLPFKSLDARMFMLASGEYGRSEKKKYVLA